MDAPPTGTVVASPLHKCENERMKAPLLRELDDDKNSPFGERENAIFSAIMDKCRFPTLLVHLV